jgi:hypothetical protein
MMPNNNYNNVNHSHKPKKHGVSLSLKTGTPTRNLRCQHPTLTRVAITLTTSDLLATATP